jgi:hypothetical protein
MDWHWFKGNLLTIFFSPHDLKMAKSMVSGFDFPKTNPLMLATKPLIPKWLIVKESEDVRRFLVREGDEMMIVGAIVGGNRLQMAETGRNWHLEDHPV